MKADNEAILFFSQYNEPIAARALQLRKLLLANLPDVQEQLDIPAKMAAYCYGQKYAEMMCNIIPSKKGLKLGFIKVLICPTHIIY